MLIQLSTPYVTGSFDDTDYTHASVVAIAWQRTVPRINASLCYGTYVDGAFVPGKLDNVAVEISNREAPNYALFAGDLAVDGDGEPLPPDPTITDGSETCVAGFERAVLSWVASNVPGMGGVLV